MERKHLRTLLTNLETELANRVEAIHKDKTNRTTSKSFSQQAVDRENDDVLGALEADAQNELTAIRASLANLDSDDFDCCVQCGEVISDERLTAIPYTRRCRHCADFAT